MSRFAALLAVAALVSSPVRAASPVAWLATAEPAVARPGEVVTLRLQATIAPPYHIYAAAKTDGGMIATSFAPSGAVEALGGLREEQPLEHHDEGFGVQVLTHEGTTVLRQPVRLPADAQPGR